MYILLFYKELQNVLILYFYCNSTETKSVNDTVKCIEEASYTFTQALLDLCRQ